MPLPLTSLKYVLVYAIESTDGLVLVDAGWNTDAAFEALSDGLASFGGRLDDVLAVLVTHIHPDHFGLAGRVKAASGCRVALHPADNALIKGRYTDPVDLLTSLRRLLTKFGAPIEEVDALTESSMPLRSRVDPIVADMLLDDGDRVDVRGTDLTAIWTPGHSPGHLCFWDESRGLMLTGDCVLPRITPNIPFHPQSGADPLGDYLASLDKLSEYSPSEVLPAHEYRFESLHDRLRQLQDHHQDRFDEVFAAIDDGLSTAWEIAARMDWARSWDEMVGYVRRSAVAEAASHLRALAVRGELVEVDGDPIRWSRP